MTGAPASLRHRRPAAARVMGGRSRRNASCRMPTRLLGHAIGGLRPLPGAAAANP